MVITGCTHVTVNGIGFTHEFAGYDDTFLTSLKKLAAAAKSGGAPAILQMFHAGNKAIPGLIPNGEVVSAGAVPSGPIVLFEKENLPKELSENEILAIIKAFGETTKRAIEAGSMVLKSTGHMGSCFKISYHLFSIEEMIGGAAPWRTG